MEDIWNVMDENEYNSIMDYQLCIEEDDVYEKVIPGNRIVQLGYVLKWAMALQHNHAKNCSGILFPYKEVPKGLGLVRSIKFCCSVCSVDIERYTEDPNKIDSGINLGAVWGSLAVGGTFSHLEEQLACMDISPISKKIFIKTENHLGDASFQSFE